MTSNYSSPGFNTALILISLGTIMFIGLAALTFFNQSLPASPDNLENSTLENPEAIMMEDEIEAIPPLTKPAPNPNSELAKPASYQGARLAGTSAPLLDFTAADYQSALKSDQLIVLYFYADWCPICRAEFPKMQAAFNELSGDQVIGFRVNFNDDETDDAEIQLARQYGVAYQHTKVLVRNNQQILKSPESWVQSRYLTEINNALK